MNGMKRLLLIITVAAGGIIAVALAGVLRPEAAQGVDDPRRDLVTTVGRGTVTTVPDVATITVGVRTEAGTAAEALERSSAQVKTVLDALRKAGSTQLRTQQVSLFPRTDDRGATTGFVAQNSVSARSKIADAGGLVDAAVVAGANTVEGPALERSDEDALYRDALEKAVVDARAKAEALGKAGNFDVGRVVSVTEEGASQPPVVYDQRASLGAKTPVEPGTQKVEAAVSVSFEIT